VQLDDVRMTGRSLAGLGGVALALGDASRAVRLTAAAWQRMESVPPFLAPCDADEYAAWRAATQAALSPAHSAEEWQRGWLATVETLVAEAEALVAAAGVDA
jgi:hypothetical protein